MFIRFDPENKPQVEITAEGSLQVTVIDPLLGRMLKLNPDILTLAREMVEIEPLVAQVNQDLCRGCGFCEQACPYGAMRLVQIPGKWYRSENIPAY
jgi:ferredoxin